MTARAFLVRGLLAGLLAGLATFLVAHEVGEPPLETAVAVEHAHDMGHSHDEDPVVSRADQRTWGLLTGTVTVAVALGGVVSLVAAGAAGRLGALTVRQSTAVVAAIGFAAVGLVPFLKYPAAPPGVGDADTIGSRTGAYFGFLLVSLLAALLVTVVAARLRARFGAYAVVVGGVAGYLLVVAVAGRLFPGAEGAGHLPADTLWDFRRASLITMATMWGVLGAAAAGLLGRLHARAESDRARRELAASL